MKIAFILNNYPPKHGGVEQHTHALATQLAAQGHQVLVYTLDAKGPAEAQEAGVTVRRLPEYMRVEGILGFPSPLAALKLVRQLAKERVDVISVHTRFFSMSWLGVLAGKTLRIPVVHTEHGSGYVVSEKVLIRQASKLVDVSLGRFTLRTASKVLVVSELSRAFVQKLAGVEAEVFYNVSPLPALEPQELVVNRKKLIFLARMVEVKGWKTFIDTVALLHAEDPGYRGLMLGGGADLEKAKDYVKSLGLESVIELRGLVDHQQVAAELAGATLVNPTVAAEGFQTTIIDAFVRQAGIVTFDVSSARTLQQQGASLHIIEDADRSATALAAAVRAEIASPAPARPLEDLKQWGWEHQGQVYAQILTTVQK